MLKSNKLIIFLISLPFLMVLIFYSLDIVMMGISSEIMRLLLSVRSSQT